jgi:hypothetical protein
VDLGAVPVVADDRGIPRKEQARLARDLFRSLGLKGVTFSGTRGSFRVEVRIPMREDWAVRAPIRAHGRPSVDPQPDPASLANAQARRAVEAILLRAFPSHDDRSDPMSDYSDSRWFIRF